MMKLKAPRIRIPRPKKRVVIISIAALLVIALGVYSFISYTTWRDLDTESKQVSRSLKTAINEALGGEKEDLSPADEMKKLVSDFEKKYSETPCTVSPFINWQTVIPQAKTIATECEQRFTTVLEVIASLKALTTFISHENQASDLLLAAIEATKSPTDYTAASATWQAAADSTDLAETSVFQLVADQIKTIATAMSTSYTSLATASQNEDKAALDAAIVSLDAAYASIAEITTLTTSERQALILDIAAAYDTL